MIKEFLKDGGIVMTNTTNKNIVYLDYKTSALAAPNSNSSVVTTATSNVIKNRTFIITPNIYPCTPKDYRS